MRLLYIPLLIAGLAMAQQPASAGEMEDRAAIFSSTRKAFLQEDFAQLESTSHSYRSAKSRTSSGLWKLTMFYAGIQNEIDARADAQDRDAAFRELEDKATKWTQQFPHSPSAHISVSMVHMGHAWAYRGAGYASSVRPEAWAPFQKYISLARQNLEAHKSEAAADPRWYETMLTIARAEGWERDEFDRLVNEALDREPAFYQTYFLALEYLLPKWHGGTDEIEAFAQDAVRRSSSQEGRGMYARIYWFASQTQFQNALFSASRATWPRMKEGFEDVIARYPDAWNLNNYAKFACLAHDKSTARELIKRIESTVVIEAWQPQSLLQRCSAWAFRE